jgi:hypothetical protein
VLVPRDARAVLQHALLQHARDHLDAAARDVEPEEISRKTSASRSFGSRHVATRSERVLKHAVDAGR